MQRVAKHIPDYSSCRVQQVVGYLKLAHLVPFSMLLEVTNMSPETIVGILGARGKRRGLLLRGNWAARAADVWPKGVSHAADCLSVAQVLLHRWDAFLLAQT